MAYAADYPDTLGISPARQGWMNAAYPDLSTAIFRARVISRLRHEDEDAVLLTHPEGRISQAHGLFTAHWLNTLLASPVMPSPNIAEANAEGTGT